MLALNNSRSVHEEEWSLWDKEEGEREEGGRQGEGSGEEGLCTERRVDRGGEEGSNRIPTCYSLLYLYVLRQCLS